jgi:succinate dehydrogenase / fumarate reductase cytochrome b subunit
MLLVVWWLAAAAASPEAFGWADAVITSWFGDLVMLLSLWAVWYHTLAGIRHLIWDTGSMLDIGRAEMLGWICVFGSVVLTILTVIII